MVEHLCHLADESVGVAPPSSRASRMPSSHGCPSMRFSVERTAEMSQANDILFMSDSFPGGASLRGPRLFCCHPLVMVADAWVASSLSFERLGCLDPEGELRSRGLRRGDSGPT